MSVFLSTLGLMLLGVAIGTVWFAGCFAIGTVIGRLLHDLFG